MDFRVTREPLHQPDVVELLQAADHRVATLYPDDDRSGPPLELLERINARFFVARDGDQALGCGGFVVLPDGSAELKRFFVRPSARGRGVGKALLDAAEAGAASEGAELMQLETGIKSHAAVAFYSRAGYRACAPFGSYDPDPLSVFMQKKLGAR